MNQLLAVLKALSDETRLQLLHLLLTRDLCGKALSKSLGISEAAGGTWLATCCLTLVGNEDQKKRYLPWSAARMLHSQGWR